MHIESLKNLLPVEASKVILQTLNTDRLQELRLRGERPIAVQYGGRYLYLTADGVSSSPERALIARRADISNAVLFASQHSVYAFSDELARGYITVAGGVRVGVAGEVVSENGRAVTLKNFSSICIRLPHEIKGCATNILQEASRGSTLILSPPGAGKTTILRDLARQLSELTPLQNLLIVDERDEIACLLGGETTMDVGATTDVISGGNKGHAFECAVRSMRPDIILTDELFGESDIDIVREAIGCGIRVIGSCHAEGKQSFLTRSFGSRVLSQRLFDRYIVYSSRKGPGTLEGIFDSAFEKINDG